MTTEGNAEQARNLVTRLRPHFIFSEAPWDPTSLDCDEVPTILRAMWSEASEWHLLAEDHYDVFGFNLWSPVDLPEKTTKIFGDEECRQEWLQDHSDLPSCAAPGWLCCMALSDYDYLLVCLDANSKQFGHVHHIVNNCDEENYCSTVGELFVHVANFVEIAKAQKEAGVTSSRDVQDGLVGINGALRRVRASIIDTVLNMEEEDDDDDDDD
eukprot:CAMPEP_0195516836 /NCGR_PEP_ID=MMETSP0794_2-20130614/8859_1 /TAXON_ID=515487 /ORGANISM="Stephanopyxis turris, Strain CCMP 815" /LENGTH=211 /DNA_ID=CAMNT_0040645537 /DNA_START=94 /DNA_END=729 /DNA_ORIENTATION=+